LNGKADGKRKTGYNRGSDCVKGVSGKVIVDEKKLKICGMSTWKN